MKKVIGIALSYEGWKETNSNNINPFAEYLDGVPGFYNGKKNGYAYCNIFVHYCFVKAYGVQTAKKMLFQPDYSLGAGCIYSARYFQENGRFITANPQEGDEIFFGNSSNCYHTGLVIGVENGRVLTIEGNTSDSVARRSYALGSSEIYGYGRPDWSVVGEAVDASVDFNEPTNNENSATATVPNTETTVSTVFYNIKLPLLKKGDENGYVKTAQLLLSSNGYSLGVYGVDGDFGQDTYAAVVSFQKNNNLTVDGEIGGETWNALLSG